MGLDSEYSRRLIFDLETAPLPDAGDYLDPAEAPANYKDPAKIEAYVAEKNAENLDRCSLDVDLCRIVALAWWAEGDKAPEAASTGGTDEGERSLLAGFWQLAVQQHLVGFNVLAYDLPVLLRRSLYLGVQPPMIAIDKYRHPSVTDLMQVLSFNGAIRFRGLSFYARRFGIEVPDDVTGASIAQLAQLGDWKRIEAHAVADVRKTAALAARLGYFRAAA